MLITVLAWSSIPLLIQLSGGAETPFLFNAGMRLGYVIVCSLFLVAFFRQVFLCRAVWQAIVPHLSSWLILFALISTFERAFFSWAVQFVDVSVAVILYDASPIFMVLLLSRLYRVDGRFGVITPSFILLVLLAFAGFTLVSASETGSVVNLQHGGAGIFLTGLLLLLLGVACNVMTVFGFRWGTELSRDKTLLAAARGLGSRLVHLLKWAASSWPFS